MKRMTELIGCDLEWIQPKALKMEYELRVDGDESIASLRFNSSLFGFLATAESADGCWTFNQIGFSKPKTVIRACASDIDFAVFENSGRGEGGILELSNGHRYLATAGLAQTRYTFKTEAGDPLIRFKPRGWLHLSANVEILPTAGNLPELPWMVMLGWYLTVIVVSPGEFAFRRVMRHCGLGR